jgi:hypothetical protein
LDRILPKPGDANAVAFWEWVISIGPVLVGVLTFTAGWLGGAFVDFQWVDQPVTFVQAFVTLGTMCFPFAAFYAARLQWNVARSCASAGWPTVPGKVEQSRIAKSRIAKSQGQWAAFYRLALAYRYEVGGQEYEGDTVQFGPRRVTAQDLIERLADKYPAGAQVTVHYDPDDPATAVLETSDEMARQNQWQVWVLLAVPFGLSIMVAIFNR